MPQTVARPAVGGVSPQIIRIVAQGSSAELLAGSGTLVRARDRAELERAMRAAGIGVTPASGNAVLAGAGADDVGAAAVAAGVPLLELRPAGADGLEELFRSLTSNRTSDTPAGTVPAGQQVEEARA